MSDEVKQVHWKDVACASCGARAGQMCGKVKLGTLNQWVRTSPHSARKKAAAAVQWLNEELAKPEVDDGGAWDEIMQRIADNPVRI